jgi:hypothetical protein
MNQLSILFISHDIPTTAHEKGLDKQLRTLSVGLSLWANAMFGEKDEIERGARDEGAGPAIGNNTKTSATSAAITNSFL